MKKQYSIYKLVDPRDDLPHYVGRTTSLAGRLSQHLNNTVGKSKKEKWISELKASGLVPLMEEVEKVVGEEKAAAAREVYWIQHFKKQGMPLTNVRGVSDNQRFTFWILKSLKKAFLNLAKDEGVSHVELLDEAMNDLFKKYRR